MALSRKPKQDKKTVKPVQEDKVAELILKGGSSPNEPSDKKDVGEEIIKLVQLRIPLKRLNEINALVKKRPGKLSRHTWIMEAIAEKVERDKQG